MGSQGFCKRVVSQRVVLADVPWTPKTGTRAQKKRTDGTKSRNEGTKDGATVQETGTRAHSPKPPFYKTALLFPLEIKN